MFMFKWCWFSGLLLEYNENYINLFFVGLQYHIKALVLSLQLLWGHWVCLHSSYSVQYIICAYLSWAFLYIVPWLELSRQSLKEIRKGPGLSLDLCGCEIMHKEWFCRLKSGLNILERFYQLLTSNTKPPFTISKNQICQLGTNILEL